MSDSLDTSTENDPRLRRIPLSPLFAETIRLLHADASLADLLART